MPRFPLLLCCLALAIPHFAPSQTPLAKAVDRFIRREVDFDQTLGLAVGVIDEQAQELLLYGYHDHRKRHPLTDTSRIELGAATKLFTAQALLQLSLDGQLALSDTLGQYLPQYPPSWQRVTLTQLLTHTAGFERYPSNLFTAHPDDIDPYYAYSEADFEAFAANAALSDTAAYQYSHIGYILLAQVIAQVSQQPFPTFVESQVLQPLRMTRSQWTRSALAPLLADGLTRARQVSQPWITPFLAGAMGLHTTPQDLMHYLQYLLRPDPTVVGKSLLAMRHPHVPTHQPHVSSGYGWHFITPTSRSHPYQAHSGETHGHQVFIAVMPATNSAVFVCANSVDDLDSLGNFILKMINNNWKEGRK